MSARKDGLPKKAPAIHHEVSGGLKPFVVQDGSKIVAEFWNRYAAKKLAIERGGMHHVFSRVEGAIIFSPLDA
jgi:hypothetical protein